MANTKIYGATGETLAKQYLIEKGYKILQVNYETKIGEIDIIAKDKNTIVFVEVKARNSLIFGLPREAVTEQKQYKIQRVAQFYLMKTKNFDKPIRFDVIEILGDMTTHIQNAF